MLVLVVIALGVSGIMFGGAWSLRQQGQPRGRVVVVLALAVLALVAGVLQLVGAMRA